MSTLRKVGAGLLCVALLGSHVLAKTEKSSQDVTLRNIAVSGSLGTDGPVASATVFMNTKSGKVAGFAQGTVTNDRLRAVKFKGLSGTEFDAPASWVCTYRVAASGLAVLRFKG
jgi:hypothetical protein